MEPIELAVWGMRGLATVASLLLLYAAFFLYPTERNLLQSKLEAWWIQLDDARARADRRRPVLVQRLAATVQRGFDWLFGEPLSMRFFVVSGLLSMVSFSLALSSVGDYGWAVPSGLVVFAVATVIAANMGHSMDRSTAELRRALDEQTARRLALLDDSPPAAPPRFASGLGSPDLSPSGSYLNLLLQEYERHPAIPARSPMREAWDETLSAWPTYLTIALLSTSSTGLVLSGAQERGVGTAVFVLAAITAFVCDAASILITMGVLDRLTRATSGVRAAGWLLLDAAIAGAMLAAPLALFWWVADPAGLVGTYLLFVASANVSTAAPSAVYVLAALALAAHRLLWPLVLRPFYNLVHAEQVRQPKVLAALGAAALVAAWPGVLQPLSPLAEKLLDLF